MAQRLLISIVPAPQKEVSQKGILQYYCFGRGVSQLGSRAGVSPVPPPHLRGSAEAEALDAGRSERAQRAGARLPHRAEQSRAWDWRREPRGASLRSRLKLLPSLGVTHRLTVLVSVLVFVTPTKSWFLNNWLMPVTELPLTELQTGFYLKSIK